MKDLIRTKVTANTGQVSDVNEFSGVDKNLKFLQKECSNKEKVINILLKDLFKREMTKIYYKDNSVKILAIDYFEETAANWKRSYVLHKPRFTCKHSNRLQVFEKSRGFTNRNNTR